MTKLQTKVYMDGGIEYIFEMGKDEFLSRIADSDGKLYSHFVSFKVDERDISLNPIHISSIEEIKVNNAQRIGIL